MFICYYFQKKRDMEKHFSYKFDCELKLDSKLHVWWENIWFSNMPMLETMDFSCLIKEI